VDDLVLGLVTRQGVDVVRKHGRRGAERRRVR
jgi:hypothetical protein